MPEKNRRSNPFCVSASSRALARVVDPNPATRLVEFDLPRRDQNNPDYRGGVDDWHDAIAKTWSDTIKSELAGGGTVALLVWGDPTLYDSTLRIASRLNPAPHVRVIPGITSIQALTASHAIPLNEIGAPFLVTTGRQLREGGWPIGSDTLVVMLDGDCAFRHLDPAGVTIWWGAYVGMPQQITLDGPLAETAPRILKARAEAREANGWIMDVYLLRRTSPAGEQR